MNEYYHEKQAELLEQAQTAIWLAERDLKNLVLELAANHVPKTFIQKHSGVSRSTINRWEEANLRAARVRQST